MVCSRWWAAGEQELERRAARPTGSGCKPTSLFFAIPKPRSPGACAPSSSPPPPSSLHPTYYIPSLYFVIPDEARSAEIGDLAVCLQPCPRHSGKAAASGRAARVLSFYFRTPSHRHLRRTGVVGEIGNLVVADHPPPLSSSPTRRGAPRSGILAMPGTPNEPARSSPFRLRANGAAPGPIRFRPSRAARPARPE